MFTHTHNIQLTIPDGYLILNLRTEKPCLLKYVLHCWINGWGETTPIFHTNSFPSDSTSEDKENLQN